MCWFWLLMAQPAGAEGVGSKLTNNTLFLQGRVWLPFAFSSPVEGSLLAFPSLMSWLFHSLPPVLMTSPWIQLTGSSHLTVWISFYLVHPTAKILSPSSLLTVLVRSTTAFYFTRATIASLQMPNPFTQVPAFPNFRQLPILATQGFYGLPPATSPVTASLPATLSVLSPSSQTDFQVPWASACNVFPFLLYLHCDDASKLNSNVPFWETFSDLFPEKFGCPLCLCVTWSL